MKKERRTRTRTRKEIEKCKESCIDDSVQRIRYDCACVCVYVCVRERDTRCILTQRIEYAS